MHAPVGGKHSRFSLGRLAAFALLLPVVLLWSSAASAATPTAGGSWSSSVAPTPADNALDALMLATPLPGLTDFTLVGPGATNGVLTAETLASYSNNPTQVEHLFNQYSAESGFAGWIKTWQDHTGTDRVVEIAIRFHDNGEAISNAAAFVTTLSQGQPGGTRSTVPSIPGATSFVIDEPATTSGSTSIPSQQVQAVVYANGDYLVVLHTDSTSGAASEPIADGTAVALALQQYEDLAASVVTPKHTASSPGVVKPVTKGGSTTRTVGVVMLCAVALVLVAFALFTWRRRRTRSTVRPATKRLPNLPEPDTVKSGTKYVAPDGSVEQRIGARLRSPARSASGQHAHKADPASRAGSRRRGRVGARPQRRVADRDGFVSVSARNGRATRSERLETSRNKHPSAAVALAHARPPGTAAGWYQDPSDDERRRIRYWDGAGWTAHVAEPEA